MFEMGHQSHAERLVWLCSKNSGTAETKRPLSQWRGTPPIRNCYFCGGRILDPGLCRHAHAKCVDSRLLRSRIPGSLRFRNPGSLVSRIQGCPPSGIGHLAAMWVAGDSNSIGQGSKRRPDETRHARCMVPFVLVFFFGSGLWVEVDSTNLRA